MILYRSFLFVIIVDDDFKYDDTSMQIVNFVPTKEIPSITYIKSVEKGSIAELAKMKPGDHIIEVTILYCFIFSHVQGH